MYIEFRLPGGAGGMAAGYTKQAIIKQLKETCAQLNLTIVQQVQQSYRFRIELANEREYTILSLAWQPKTQWFRFKLFDEPITAEYDPNRYINKHAH